MWLFLLILVASVSFAGEVRPVTRELVQSRFARLRPTNEERALELRRLFGEAGCTAPNYSEQKLLSSKTPNIICMLPGSSKETVVVSAHFDKRGPGEGAIDNWSGASLLPSLFECMRDGVHRLSFEFVGFTDEEKGLIGSREYTNQLSKQRRPEILLDANIDSIGLAGPVRVWAQRSDDFLLTSAAVVADAQKIPLGANVMDRRYDSDAGPFIAWNIPVIDFHSLTGETVKLLHTKGDNRGALDPNSYYDQYRFLVAYLGYLDATLQRANP